jgi:hypothetical protein
MGVPGFGVRTVPGSGAAVFVLETPVGVTAAGVETIVVATGEAGDGAAAVALFLLLLLLQPAANSSSAADSSVRRRGIVRCLPEGSRRGGGEAAT